MLKNFYSRLADLIAPRQCLVCGQRLDLGETSLCANCNMWLPRTDFALKPYDNAMAQLFYLRINVERCAALFFYEPHAAAGRLIYALKYWNRPQVAETLGRIAATEMLPHGFFEGIDAIIPMPLAKRRERERGYNQSVEIARGVASVIHIPILRHAARRIRETPSQTTMHSEQRIDNVADAFRLTDEAAVSGRHVLIIDDVVTTGATVCALGTELMKAGDVAISVLSLGFTKS